MYHNKTDLIIIFKSFTKDKKKVLNEEFRICKWIKLMGLKLI